MLETPKPQDLVDDLFPGEEPSLTPPEQEALELLRPRMAMIFEQSGARLPPFPRAAARVYEVASQADPDTRELVRALGTDGVLTAQILKVANSGFYSRGTRIESARDAVVRLGGREVARIAGVASAQALFDPGERGLQTVAPALWNRTWQHSLATGLGACVLAMRLRGANTEEAFLGGLLHDVGRIAGLRALAAHVVGAGRIPGLTDAVVAELVASSGEEIGAQVAVMCELPERVAAYCSALSSVANDMREGQAVAMASALDALGEGDRDRRQHRHDVRRAAIALGFDEFAVRAFATEMRTTAARAVQLGAGGGAAR